MKLIEIQNELKVPKGNLNKFGNYKYRSAEDILEALKPILKKHNAVLILTDSIDLIGGKYFLKATAQLFIEDIQLTSNGFAELGEHKGMSTEQCTGTASSYARKYALNGLFLIDETESDADSVNKGEEKKEDKPQVTEWLTEEQFNVAMQSDKKGILATLKAFNGANGKGMKKEYNLKLTEQLSKAK